MTTDHEALVKLLPCPFCGSDEAELQNTHTPSFWIECLSCGATARGKYFPTKAKESQHYDAEPRGFNERNFKGLTGAYKKAAESAITAWNHRAALSAQGGEQPLTDRVAAALHHLQADGAINRGEVASVIRELAAELEEANRRAEAAERQLARRTKTAEGLRAELNEVETLLARYREKYGELE